MALKGGFSRVTRLQLALERGTRPGAKLGDELSQLGDYCIKSKADAESVCQILARYLRDDATMAPRPGLGSLIGLFQEVEGPHCPAFATMIEVGIPLLIELVDAGCDADSNIDPDDVLFALKILAMYGTSDGTDAAIRAAALPFEPDSYCWHLILEPFGAGHPHAERLLEALSDPLPVGFLALSLIDCANAAQEAGMNCSHPFDTDLGIQRLDGWLRDADREQVAYALSATAALPYLSSIERERLLLIALDHRSADVRLEAANACAKLGLDAGIKYLAGFCTDVHRSEKALQHLAELGREDAVPPEALDPDFRAQAEFSQWLAHPSELGRPPDFLEILDKRTLAWPPDRASRMLWLIKYRVTDEIGMRNVGVGLVGSVTYCLFDYELELRKSEDVYAIHCYWELETKGLIADVLVEAGSTEYDAMLRQVTQISLIRPRITRVVELSPELEYPQRLVALGRANQNGEAGFIIVDGPRSQWYPASEMPGDQSDKQVVMIHVGRVLLGFARTSRQH